MGVKNLRVARAARWDPGVTPGIRRTVVEFNETLDQGKRSCSKTFAGPVGSRLEATPAQDEELISFHRTSHVHVSTSFVLSSVPEPKPRIPAEMPLDAGPRSLRTPAPALRDPHRMTDNLRRRGIGSYRPRFRVCGTDSVVETARTPIPPVHSPDLRIAKMRISDSFFAFPLIARDHGV